MPTHTVTIYPDWKPIESAPKDGSEVMFLHHTAGFEQPEIRTSHSGPYFWGRMIAFPQEECWVSSKNPDNGTGPTDQDFVDEHFIYDHAYQEQHHHLYRGCKITHWARPWDIEIVIAYKPQPELSYVEKIFNK